MDKIQEIMWLVDLFRGAVEFEGNKQREKARGAIESALRELVREPLSDKEIGIGAFNEDSNDWMLLECKNSWHDGFKCGARFAESEHGIKK